MSMHMFRRRGTIIAEGLKIVGSVTAEGLVEVNGHIEGICIAPRSSSRPKPRSRAGSRPIAWW